MAYITTLSTQKKSKLYYRFTCEKCGCRSHWIARDFTSTLIRNYRGSFDQSAAVRHMTDDLNDKFNQDVEALKKSLDECLSGKRMLVEPFGLDIMTYFGNTACPKCKQIQSWSPRMAPGFFKRTMQKNADVYNATPILSEPDIVFGGDLPEDDVHDLAKPCTIEIHGSSFGHPNGSPVYLNGKMIAQTIGNRIDISVLTGYRDNIIQISDLSLYSFYIEADEGQVIQYEYKNMGICKAKEI